MKLTPLVTFFPWAIVNAIIAGFWYAKFPESRVGFVVCLIVSAWWIAASMATVIIQAIKDGAPSKL